MANEEVLGPRKTMFVLVIVVGCFAVLWPRILSPLLVGHQRAQLQPNQFDRDAAIKQERPPIRGAGPHPALRERGRAIPPGAPPGTPQVHIQMPPNVRVRTSPLQGYFELDIKPPPIPGMRPPLGSPGGPVPAPKSSMGFVMPIYTICIIVFFVYTISKLFFKRATIPYEPVTPDPQFRRRVFRDDSRSSPDKLVVTAISGLVAEVQQQMEAGYAQNQQRQDVQDNHTRPYTNGTIIHNTGPVHIVASEYEAKDNIPEPKEPTSGEKEPSPDSKSKAALEEVKEELESDKDDSLIRDSAKETDEDAEVTENQNIPTKDNIEEKELTEALESTEEQVETKGEIEESDLEKESQVSTDKDAKESSPKEREPTPEKEEVNNLVDLTEPIDIKRNGDIRTEVEDFLKKEAKSRFEDEKTKELLEEAIGEEEDKKKENKEEEDEEVDEDQEKSSVKVMGMEVRAHAADGGAFPPPPAAVAPPPPAATSAPQRTPHEAEEVKSIYLETAIPQQSRVLVAECEDSPRPHDHSPMVVSGKMTLSLIQDAPRDTPERDLESTMDDFTTASGVTQPAEKEGSDSEEEVEEEEIEIEEIEEEEEEEVEDDEEEEQTGIEKSKHAPNKETE